MRSTEDKAIREQMVDMHQFFIDRIGAAINAQRYIEASWLIYSCIENRFFRVLQKYKKQCKYCQGKCKKNTNELAISTKIGCVRRLVENGVTCLSDSFSVEQLEEIRLWVKKRNDLMHDLLSLETYRNTDDDFRDSAMAGQEILTRLYSSCTRFRALFYADGYDFVFPEEAMEGCSCGKRNNDEVN